jgi:hypothetical protein
MWAVAPKEKKIVYLTTLSVSEVHKIDHRMINDNGVFGGMRIGRGKLNTSEITRPTDILPTTNPTLPDLVSNPGRRRRKKIRNV